MSGAMDPRAGEQRGPAVLGERRPWDKDAIARLNQRRNQGVDQLGRAGTARHFIDGAIPSRRGGLTRGGRAHIWIVVDRRRAHRLTDIGSRAIRIDANGKTPTTVHRLADDHMISTRAVASMAARDVT